MPQNCHHTLECPFYANCLECTKDTRIDVILFRDYKEGRPVYDCMALLALSDPEKKIPIKEELEYELSNPDLINELPCPLNSLNYPTFLEDKIKDLIKLLKK
jgi:hypothetical protein